MTNAARAVLVLAAASMAGAVAAPIDGHFAAKALAGRGDRFIEVAGEEKAARFVNLAADRTIVYGAGAIEMRKRGAGAQALRYEFAGAAGALPQGESASGITYNFLVGPRERWLTGLKSYGRVTYRDAWPGIDATYAGDAAGIKYHFTVKAGGDPKRIRFVVRGAEKARIAADGAVEWIAADGTMMRDEPPVAYQSDSRGDTLVRTAFTLEQSGEAWSLGFSVGDYDRARTLIVDPAWTAFAGLVGGNAADQVYGVARDAAGNTFACGVTASTDLPASVGAFDTTANGGMDAFVVKFNEAGAPQFVTYVGGAGFDVCTSVALSDVDGSIHLAGGTTSTNFPFAGAADGNFRKSKATSDRDAFVARLSSTGDALVYSGVIGGSGEEQAAALAVSAGRCYVTGYTGSPDFPLVGGGPGATRAGALDAFVTRVSPTGAGLEYSGLIGGNGDNDAGWGIAVVADGTAYVVGETDSTAGLPSQIGTFRTIPGTGTADGFVARISPAGAQQQFSVLTGGSVGVGQSGADRALSIAVDQAGYLFVGGETSSSQFPANDAGAQIGATSPGGNMDGFLVRISPSLLTLDAYGYIGGAGFEGVEAVATAGLSVFFAGTTTGAGFPTIATSGLATSPLGLQDGFVGRIGGPTPSGMPFLGFVGSASNDAMHAIFASPTVLALGGAVSVNSLPLGNTAALSGAATATNGVVLRVNLYGVANTLAIVYGTPQTANVGALFSNPLQVRVTDADGVGVPGVSVTFTPPGAGASAVLSPASPVTTDANGYALVNATANLVPGTYNVTASAGGVAPVDFTLTNVAIAAVALRKQRIDFNADSKGDLLWKHSGGNYGIWLMNGLANIGSAALASDPGMVVKRLGDYDGDGRTDIVWRRADGSYRMDRMFGLSAIDSATLLPAASGWELVAHGDFNGDGKADLVWKRTSDGLHGMWLMNGTTALPGGAGATPTPGAGFDIALVGDFDGNGKSDLLWTHPDGRAVVALMDGLAVSSSAQVLPAGTGWSPTHAGDFNADSKADLVWKKADGSYGLWLMNGLALSPFSLLGPGTGWSIKLVTDLDGDSKDDLVWERTDGAVGGWLMDGATMTAFASMMPAGAGWAVMTSQDFDGNGKGDLVWRRTDGTYAIWLMNGLTLSTSAYVLGGGGGWEIGP